MSDRETPRSGAGDRSGIEPALLNKLGGTITRATMIGVAGTAVFVVLIVLGIAKTLPPAPTAIAGCAAFLMAAFGFAVMANKRMVRTVGREHGWRTVPAEVQLIGPVKRRRVQIRVDRVQIRVDDVVLQAADGYSNTNKLAAQQRLDVAGRAPGRYLVRIPGTQAIYVYRRVNR